MNVALVTISDRGDLYYPQCVASMAKHLQYDFDLHIHVDDREHKLGLAGAVQQAWSQVPVEMDYVFHVEEDFVFTEDVDIEAMAKCLFRNPHCAQLVLKRQPWSMEERAAGGIMEMHPDLYVSVGMEWTEHRRIFSLNPCLIPARIIDMGWPDGNEAEMTERLLERSFCFGFWGKPSDPPRCLHIGAQRGQGWRL